MEQWMLWMCCPRDAPSCLGTTKKLFGFVCVYARIKPTKRCGLISEFDRCSSEILLLLANCFPLYEVLKLSQANC